MLKNLAQLEANVEGKAFRFVCDNDSAIGSIKEALFQFQKFIGQMEDAAKAQQSTQAAPQTPQEPTAPTEPVQPQETTQETVKLISSPQQDFFQAIPASQFDPATLSGTFQPVFTNGFPDNIKILEIYNGGAVAMDVSYNGTDLNAVWPAGATLIVDLQTNHDCNPPYGSGTLNGRAGQNVWVRTCQHPTFLTIGGFR